MPTPSTRLRVNLQDPGSNLNVWGTKLNNEALALLDEAVAGVEKITLSASTYTLSSANYTADQARNAGLIFQGTPTATVTVTVPAVEKVYVCVNQTAQTVNLTCGGVAASLAAGDQATVWCDGTDCGLGSISVGTVNGLITNAALSGTLPGQSGNSGKFLQTNGTTPLWADVNIPTVPDFAGGADATVTTSTTLTNTSSVVQSASMSSAAQSITLPDATTLTKGGRKFVVLNTGDRTFGVRSNGGTLLTVVPAGAVAELHLYDNATAAGGWGVTGRGLEPALTLVDHTAPANVVGNASEVACRLTDNLSIHFGGYGSASLSALAVDSTPGAGTVGTWTTVDATGVSSGTAAHCFRISDTQAIVFWISGANHKAAVLTVSGTTVSVGSAVTAAEATVLTNVTFTGRPLIAQLTATSYVVPYISSGQVRSVAFSVSGTTVTTTAFGSILAIAAGGQQVLACYRVSDTTALALYIDDSGTAGAPYSIRGAVLSVSGTTVTVGTSNGINDVMANPPDVIPTCQLSATKYLVGYNSATTSARAAAFTVSGTSISVGSPVSIETIGLKVDVSFGNANRFQPNLVRLTDTTAVLSYGDSSTAASRHVLLTESAGAVTASSILYSLWTGSTGGNFPQTPQGFLAFSTNADEQAIFGVTVNGTALSVTGTFLDGSVLPSPLAGSRFGLSGGVCGVAQVSVTANFIRYGLIHLFRFIPNGPPRYLGPLRLNDANVTTYTPVEVAANKVAVIAAVGLTQPSASGTNVRLQIVEFAAL